MCTAEVARGTGRRLTSTKGPKEEVAAQVLDGREGGKILYGGYCTEGGSRRPEEERLTPPGSGRPDPDPRHHRRRRRGGTQAGGG